MEPNNPSPQPIEQPHVNTYNKAHVFLMAVAVLAVVACVSFALGMFMQHQSDTAVNPYLKAVATPVPTKIVATPTTDPTAGWKIYNAHGFSLKYPQTWIYKENITVQPVSTFFYDPSTASNTGNGGLVQYADNLTVRRIPYGPTQQTVQQYIDSLQSQQYPAALAAVFQKKTITLNGKQTEVYYQGGEGTVGWYIPFANGTGFDIFGPLSTDPSQDSIELQIIKTFSLSQ